MQHSAFRPCDLAMASQTREHPEERILPPRHIEIVTGERQVPTCKWSRLILYWPLYQYSRRRAQWRHSTGSLAVAMWRYLRLTGIQNMFRITSKILLFSVYNPSTAITFELFCWQSRRQTHKQGSKHGPRHPVHLYGSTAASWIRTSTAATTNGNGNLGELRRRQHQQRQLVGAPTRRFRYSSAGDHFGTIKKPIPCM